MVSYNLVIFSYPYLVDLFWLFLTRCVRLCNFRYIRIFWPSEQWSDHPLPFCMRLFNLGCIRSSGLLIVVRPSSTFQYGDLQSCGFCNFLCQDIVKVCCCFFIFYSLEKEILDRYLEAVLKGNKDGLKVRSELPMNEKRRKGDG